MGARISELSHSSEDLVRIASLRCKKKQFNGTANLSPKPKDKK